MNEEGVFKVRAAQPYHKYFEVPPPLESLSRIYPIHVFYLPGVSNVFHIGAIYFYNKHRIYMRMRAPKGVKGVRDHVNFFRVRGNDPTELFQIGAIWW